MLPPRNSRRGSQSSNDVGSAGHGHREAPFAFGVYFGTLARLSLLARTERKQTYMNRKLTNHLKFHFPAAGFLALGASLVASGAQAQPAAEGDAEMEAGPAQEEEAAQGMEQEEVAQGMEQETGTQDQPPEDEGGDSGSDFAPDVEDRRDERPDPPGGAALGDEEDVDPPPVVRGAGMGSDIAYAEKGVVELGGQASLNIRDELLDFQAAPTIGYFVIDRLELTLIPILRITKTTDGETGVSETFVRVAGVLEPSYHMPITDDLFAFAGLGIGATYEEGPGFEFLLRPVVGVDIMVGRSGILKPAGFIDIGLGDGAIGGGFQAGYTVMF